MQAAQTPRNEVVPPADTVILSEVAAAAAMSSDTTTFAGEAAASAIRPDAVDDAATVDASQIATTTFQHPQPSAGVAAHAVTSSELAPSPATPAEIATSATTLTLSAGPVGTSDVVINADASPETAACAIVTNAVATTAVDADELAAEPVVSAKCAEDSVVAVDIAAEAVPTSDTARSAVDALASSEKPTLGAAELGHGGLGAPAANEPVTAPKMTGAAKPVQAAKATGSGTKALVAFGIFLALGAVVVVVLLAVSGGSEALSPLPESSTDVGSTPSNATQTGPSNSTQTGPSNSTQTGPSNSTQTLTAVWPDVSSGPVELQASAPVALNVSKPGQLFLLSRIDNSVDPPVAIPIAQSFDGQAWEPTQQGLLRDWDCSGDTVIGAEPGSACVIRLPSASGYTWQVSGSEAPAATHTERAARFLMSASFGATPSTLSAFPSSNSSFEANAQAWIDHQLLLPATSHRAYYRRRANPPLASASRTGGIRGPCEVDSRWVATDIDTTTANATGVLVGTLDLVELNPPVPGVKLLATRLSTCNASSGDDVYGSDGNSTIYKFEKRLRLVTNTKNSLAGAKNQDTTSCATVARNPFNEDSCVIGASSCSTITTRDDVPLAVDSTLLQHMYTETGHVVYAIVGLRLEDGTVPPPCDAEVSRWVRVDGGCNDASNNSFIEAAVQQAVDRWNVSSAAAGAGASLPRVVDLRTMDAACVNLTAGVVVNADIGGVATCWRHSHPDEYNVYDFTSWAARHPGNRPALEAGRAHPIQSPRAEYSLSTMLYPVDHPMSRWATFREGFPLIGVWLGTVFFADLPDALQTVQLAQVLGVLTSDVAAADAMGHEACGSPGEVANEPSRGARFTMGIDGSTANQGLDQLMNAAWAKQSVWTNVVMSAEDQLRQRVAWAFAQLFVVNSWVVPQSSSQVELFQVFYDILVRNALGNFRDMLREVSYSPMMAYMLSFINSRSLLHSGRYPDENYAREVMQLFSIGLWKMNNDGTPVVDDSGQGVPTYTQADILDYSRAWTGFKLQTRRGNYENFKGDNSANYVDPLQLDAVRRDRFPKLGLDGKYIGDGVPLCTSLPRAGFLKAGATYKYMGTTHQLRMNVDPSSITSESVAYRRLRLDNSSALHAALCRPDAAGRCSLHSTVRLPQNLNCTGVECNIDAPRAVQVVGARNITFYYEYVQPACVVMTFFGNGTGAAVANTAARSGICVDRRFAAAQYPCCQWSSGRFRVEDVPFMFTGERVTYQTGADRCHMLGMQECPGRFYSFSTSTDLDADQGDMQDYWISSPCRTQAQVFPDGSVSVVHTFDNDFTESRKDDSVMVDSMQIMRVLWEGENFPTVDSNCGSTPRCVVHKQTCLCGVEENTTPVFKAAAEFAAANASSILSRLSIGSLPPANLTASYVQCATSACGQQSGFTVYVDNGDNVVNNMTIISMDTERGTQYFANLRSTVSVAGTSFAFRNPPNHMRLWEPSVRDAMYETEAVLDSYFAHPNVAPFIAKTLISKLTTSNPSPGYVHRVATAFRRGKNNGRGSGQYGDLAATVSAVLLDREALSVAQQANPMYGAVREPLLKLLHVQRAMSLRVTGGSETVMKTSVMDRIGIFPYMSETVFNFYQPAHSPPGALASNGLVSPESQLLTAPYIVGLLNGLLSLNMVGMSRCYGGFSDFRKGKSGSCSRQFRGVDDAAPVASGHLSFDGMNASTTASLLSDMDLLLTGGRMHPFTKSAILDAYARLVAHDGMSPARARKMVVQMVLSSAEFHQTGGHKPLPAATNSSRNNASSGSNPPRRPYRALVYLFLAGGTDSYNVLVPRSDCVGGEDLFAHYDHVRGNVAMTASELTDVDVPTGTQPCNRFGVIKELDHVVQQYSGGNATFIANVGPLVEPIADKVAFKQAATRRPPSLFAHNIQTKATQTTFAQFATTSTGVMGRIRDTATKAGVRVGSYSLAGNVVALNGDGVSSRAYDVVSPSAGVVAFDPSTTLSEVEPYLQSMLRNQSASLVANVWLNSASDGISRSASLAEIIDNATLQTTFPAMQVSKPTKMAQQFYRTAQLIASRAQLGNERDMFMLKLGGFDTHSDAKEILQTKAAEIDEALASFSAEMKAQGLWNNVTVLIASEFGRTLTSNGVGTDHAWGGNAVMLGGGLRGGKVLGQYPRYMNESNPMNIGRGRLIPTSSWEAVWGPLAEWMGVEPQDMAKVLPNAANFAAHQLFSVDDVFEE